MLDYIIANGRIVDGTGNRWYRADLGVLGDRIAVIGKGLDPEARRTIDASGMVVSPGFIDMHSHSDLMLLVDSDCSQKVYQGVTTELVGQDGISVAPVRDEMKDSLRRQVAGLLGNPDVQWDWNSLGEYLECVEKRHTSTNVITLVPYGQIRQSIMGDADRAPGAGELASMKALADESIREGAVGVSIGLIYPPCVYATGEEIAAVLEGVARKGAFLVSHIRNESDHLLDAIEEVLTISRNAESALHISHLKAAGKSNWSKTEALLERLDQATANGQEISFDQYPYVAASTMFGAVFPPWSHAGGPDALLARLEDAQTRERIMAEMNHPDPAPWENWVRSCGWDNIIVTSVESEANEEIEGMTVEEIAEKRGVSPAEAACDLMIEEDTAVSMVMFWGEEEGVQKVLQHPAHTVGSDGLLGGKPHPRVYGTFPRVLGHYVRDRGVLPLEDAIRRMTSFPAQRLGLQDRGILKAGMYADITVFDPETIRDRATFLEPRQYPDGVNYVLANGQIIIDQGRHTGNRPGRVLRK